MIPRPSRSALAALAFAISIPLAGAREPAQTPGIRWRALDRAALEEAREQKKLLMLSILAPWGHWDRIMTELTFSDPRVVALLNEKFIPVKADPLLRPDIYTRYGLGGWPTTTFLIADGKPLYLPDRGEQQIARAGGNFFAAEPLAAYLEELASFYEANREAADTAAEEIAEAALRRKEVADAPLSPDILEATVTKVLEAYAESIPDPRIKSARHPDPDSVRLGIYYFAAKGSDRVLQAVLTLLTDMARGGLRDQIGGGFHRHAIDAAWRVPVFEKMLDVNAEMLAAYNEAYRLTLSDRYRDIAEGVVGYVMGTLRDPGGWFYAYQAADATLGQDGDYYTWTLEEVKSAVTPEELEILRPAYDIGEWGEMTATAPRRNVVFLFDGPVLLSRRINRDPEEIARVIDAGRRKLLEARGRRTPPPVGRVLVTASNAAMAEAMIGAADAWGRDDLRQAAVATLDLMWEKVRDAESGLMDRAWTPQTGRAGLAEFFSDQVRTTLALIAAHESTGEPRHLERAKQLAASAGKAFENKLDGGFMDRLYEPELPGLISWPSRSLEDNALFAHALVRLHYHTGEPEDGPLLRSARRTLEAWADEFAAHNQASAPFGLSVSRLLDPPVEVILLGSSDQAGYNTLLDGARRLWHPWVILRHAPAGAPSEAFSARGVRAGDTPGVALCRAASCQGPYGADEDLTLRFKELLTPPPPARPGRDGS